MSESIDGNATSLTEQKLAAEVEKLRIENSNLRAPSWRSPTFLLSVGGLALSLVGNVIQFQSGQAATTNAARQTTLAEQRWTDDKGKLAAELDALRQKTKSSADNRAAIQAELARLNEDINVWDNALFKDNLELMQLEQTLFIYQEPKDSEKADITREQIKLQKDMIRKKTEYKNLATSRRAELEKRLAC